MADQSGGARAILGARPEKGISLGGKLRSRRTAVGKTVRQVAEDTGLTAGFISQIERDISLPSLASLYLVAKALDTTVDMFVSQSPQRDHSPVSRIGKRPVFDVGGTERKYEFLERGFPGASLNACISHVPPGFRSEVMRHEGEDFLYLVAGEMLYVVDGKEYFLRAGDTLHFKASLPHTSENAGEGFATELWIGTMPLFPE